MVANVPCGEAAFPTSHVAPPPSASAKGFVGAPPFAFASVAIAYPASYASASRRKMAEMVVASLACPLCGETTMSIGSFAATRRASNVKWAVALDDSAETTAFVTTFSPTRRYAITPSESASATLRATSRSTTEAE